jgi:hypothetical protein
MPIDAILDRLRKPTSYVQCDLNNDALLLLDCRPKDAVASVYTRDGAITSIPFAHWKNDRFGIDLVPYCSYRNQQDTLKVLFDRSYAQLDNRTRALERPQIVMCRVELVDAVADMICEAIGWKEAVIKSRYRKVCEAETGWRVINALAHATAYACENPSVCAGVRYAEEKDRDAAIEFYNELSQLAEDQAGREQRLRDKYVQRISERGKAFSAYHPAIIALRMIKKVIPEDSPEESGQDIPEQNDDA